MREDRQLLSEFCRNGSESAFRELVNRHLKLVYSAAMRIVNGDVHLAQDISQLVFSKLARKALSLPADVVLAGWLHRDARFTALEVLRKERRRIMREQEAVKMHEGQTDGLEMDWAALRPMLDEILDELNETDRHALLLRFFEQRSLAQVGSAMGLTEDAARKRVARGLEKLRELLVSRGITTTVTALSMLVTTRGTETVPTGLAGALTRTALAGVGTAAGSTPGIISLITSTKIVPLLGTLAAVLVLGGVIKTIFKSNSSRVQAESPQASAVQIDTNRISSYPAAARAADTITDTSLASALHKVEEALHDPIETTNFPNPVMEVAIEQLGAQKKAANPILNAALKDQEPMVRMRAVDGIGMVGREVKEATPFLLEMLRHGGLGGDIRWTMYGSAGALIGIEPDNLILCALGQIGPAPEILPELAQLLKENPAACHTASRAAHTFLSDRKCMLGANWLRACANGDSAALNHAFSPLLQDGEPEVRRMAAFCLAGALGTEADAGIFPVVTELLRSNDDNMLRLDGLTLLARTLEDQSALGQIIVTSSSTPTKPPLMVDGLGDALDEIVAALNEVATKTQREDLRLEAWRFLDALNPDFRKDNPHTATAMEQEEQLAAFRFKVQTGRATVPEMLQGLKQFPKAAPVVAEALVNRGSEAREALPALEEAMTLLAPLPDASGPDRMTAIRAREQLANAMQKIAPDLPKPLFTDAGVRSIFGVLTDPVVRADANRHARISAALKAAGWPTRGPFDASPEQVRRLLSALKEADGPIYDAVGARVKEIDPLFR